jgi:hypothetical protein
VAKKRKNRIPAKKLKAPKSLKKKLKKKTRIMSRKREKPDPPPLFVTQQDCTSKHAKIDLALFGSDGRGGMVADISQIKTYIATMQNQKQDQKKQEEKRVSARRIAVYTFLSGAGIALLTWVLSQIHA